MAYTLKIHDRQLAGGYSEWHLLEPDFIALADRLKAGDVEARTQILQRGRVAQASLEYLELYENGHLIATIK